MPGIITSRSTRSAGAACSAASASAPLPASKMSQKPCSAARIKARLTGSSSTTSTRGRFMRSAPAAGHEVVLGEQELGVLVAGQRGQIGEVLLQILEELHLAAQRGHEPPVLLLQHHGLEGEVDRHAQERV